MVIFVTALIDLNEDRPVDKTMETRIAQTNKLLSCGERFHVFLTPNLRNKVHVPNGTIEYIQLEDLETYKVAPIGLPSIRNEAHDTRNFLILINGKSELVYRAIQSQMYNSSHYAWIDSSILHVMRTVDLCLEHVREIGKTNYPSPCVYIPGCWDKQVVNFSAVQWRFCGGFFLGDKESLVDMYTRQIKILPTIPNLTWEVNTWAYMEEQGWSPTWYKADHNDSILYVPYTSTIVRVPPNVPLYWSGQYSQCHVGSAIERYVSESIRRQPKKISAIFTQSDGLIGQEEYERMASTIGREEHINTPAGKEYAALETSASLGTDVIVCMLCTRQFNRQNLLLLPLDDDTFNRGLTEVLSPFHRPAWKDRKPQAFWRGGSSGCDRPMLRQRVLDVIFDSPHADVAFTLGGWSYNDAIIPNRYFKPNRVDLAKHFEYKYIFIIDGNCIASAHQWVFGSGSVPIMITHPDNNYWFKSYLKPMVNYVPIAYDLSDLEEKLNWLVTHDEEAEQIANNALKLSNTIFTSEFQRYYIDAKIMEIAETPCDIPNDEPEHYPLLMDIAKQHNNATFFDIGTHEGKSAYCLSMNPKNQVYSFDIVNKPNRPIRKNIQYLQDDLMNPTVRELWKEKLLASTYILLDIDPHDGVLEYEFYEWLRDNNYQGTLLCDDIWYFKGMRNNFWYKIPPQFKEDITHLGHWSGTGRIQFKSPVIQEPNWTVVTAYFDLTSQPDASKEIKSHPFEYYLESAIPTLSVEQNLVVFCEPEYLERIQQKRPEWLQSRTKYITMKFTDFPLYEYYDQITKNRIHTPSYDPRNTVSYYLFCMYRCSMLKKVIEENVFGSTHFAWMNFCIERMGWKNLRYMNDMFKENRNLFSTCYIDYQPKQNTDIVVRNGWCTLCSGFYTGNKESMYTFCNRMEEKFKYYVQKGLGHADEQIINAVYHDDPSLFDVYYGDYHQMITNYCRVYDEPSRPIHQLIKHSYDYSDYKVCLRACQTLWKSFTEGYTDLKEQDVTALLWYYRLSLKHLGLPRKFT